MYGRGARKPAATESIAAPQKAGESNWTMPPVRWKSTAFSAASMVTMDIMLIPAAVFAAVRHERRSRPKRSKVVSRSSEAVTPDATNTCQQLLQMILMSHILDRAMVVDNPRSAWNDCRYHMAEKSPTVQPTRHRSVLIPALFHTGVELQNCVEDNDSAAAALLGHSVLALLLVHASLRCTVDSKGWVSCHDLHAKNMERCNIIAVKVLE